MSGGHWEYAEFRHREAGELFRGLVELLPDLEHELDWGLSGDSCLTCARLNVGRAIEMLLDDSSATRASQFLRVAPAVCHRCQQLTAYQRPEGIASRRAWWGEEAESIGR